MSADSMGRTLLEDWRVRRSHLAGASISERPYTAPQVAILDYLIGRYGDSAEAARPARCPARLDLFVNDRAMVVHDHLWEGRVAGTRSRKEAERRVTSIVRRMTSFEEETDKDAEEHVEEGAEQRDVPEPPGPHRPWLPRLILRRDQIESLYKRLADPQREEPRAADLLARCANRSMLNWAVLAWRERVAAGRRDKVTRKLQKLFFRHDLCQNAAGKVAALLADDNALVRLEATAVLGRLGSLEHVGLLSDLLCLPPLDDEDPRERDALLQAMQSISRGPGE